MDFCKLKYFISVARHLSFTRAAEECHVAQTVISRQVAGLEEEIGVKLLYRSNRQVELTPAGKKFYDETIYLLQYYYGMVEHTQKAGAGYEGTLKIGVGPYEPTLVRQYLRKYLTRYPGVSINCMQFSYGIVPFRFTRGLVDLVFCSQILAKEFDNSIMHEVYPNHWLLAARADHSFWTLTEEKQAVLEDQTLIVLEDDLTDDFKYKCAALGYRPREYSKTNFYSTQLLMVESGIGIAFLPGFLKDDLPEMIRTRDVYDLSFLYSFTAVHLITNHNPCLPNFLNEL